MRLEYREIWVIDFEFRGSEDATLEIVCMVAQEVRSGKQLRLWGEELKQLRSPPFLIDNNALIVAFYASAEMRCFLSLGWQYPQCLLDLYVECKLFNNGLVSPHGHGLLGRAVQYGISGTDKSIKTDTRDLILSKGLSVTPQEKKQILDYCHSDVSITTKLLTIYQREAQRLFQPTMQNYWQQALFRGEYMKAVAKIEQYGIPLNKSLFEQITTQRNTIQTVLIQLIDNDNLYDGVTFKRDRFIQYLNKHEIKWPYANGCPKLDTKTFEQLAKQYPQIKPLATLRSTLSKLKDNKFEIGSDARQRVLLSPYASRTGRNQPSNSKFIFGAPKWMRHLIQPPPDHALIYVDYCQQEFGIAAALSCDDTMKAAYASSDPYLAFAKQANLAPDHATKASHPSERKKAKACVLAVQYGMGEQGLAHRLQIEIAEARHLLALHRKTYHRFWAWSEQTVRTALARGYLDTVCGWRLYLPADSTLVNKRMLQNYPMQANGAEMLRIAIINLVHDGIKICAPVHDALLIEAKISTIGETLEKININTRAASKLILEGFILRYDQHVVHYPHAFSEDADSAMWETVLKALSSNQNNSLGGSST